MLHLSLSLSLSLSLDTHGHTHTRVRTHTRTHTHTHTHVHAHTHPSPPITHQNGQGEQLCWGSHNIRWFSQRRATQRAINHTWNNQCYSLTVSSITTPIWSLSAVIWNMPHDFLPPFPGQFCHESTIFGHDWSHDGHVCWKDILKWIFKSVCGV